MKDQKELLKVIKKGQNLSLVMIVLGMMMFILGVFLGDDFVSISGGIVVLIGFMSLIGVAIITVQMKMGYAILKKLEEEK